MCTDTWNSNLQNLQWILEPTVTRRNFYRSPRPLASRHDACVLASVASISTCLEPHPPWRLQTSPRTEEEGVFVRAVLYTFWPACRSEYPRGSQTCPHGSARLDVSSSPKYSFLSCEASLQHAPATISLVHFDTLKCTPNFLQGDCYDATLETEILCQ